MKRTLLFGLLAAGLLAAAPAKADEAVFHIAYAGKTTDFTAEALAALPHQDFTATDAHDKKTHVYSAVSVRTLLATAGAPLGEKLRGPALRLVVIAHTLDHYEVAFALAEFDAALSDRTILLADHQDGQPLPGGIGPFRLLAPGDKRPARWARMVTELEIVSVGEPRP